jgi:hypothetical protein
MFKGTDLVLDVLDTSCVSSPQTFLTNPSKLRNYLWKIPAVITETLII